MGAWEGQQGNAGRSVFPCPRQAGFAYTSTSSPNRSNWLGRKRWRLFLAGTKDGILSHLPKSGRGGTGVRRSRGWGGLPVTPSPGVCPCPQVCRCVMGSVHVPFAINPFLHCRALTDCVTGAKSPEQPHRCTERSLIFPGLCHS